MARRSTSSTLGVIGFTAGFFIASARGAEKLVTSHLMLAMPRDGGAMGVEPMREQIRMWQDLGLDATMLFDLGPPDNSSMRDAAKRYHLAAAAEGYHVAISTSYFWSNEVAYVSDFIAELSKPPYAAGQLLKDGKVFVTAYHAPGWFPQLLDRLRSVNGIDTYAEPQIFPRLFVGIPGTQPWENGLIYSFSPPYLAIMMDHPNWQGLQGFAAWELGDSLDMQAQKITWINDAAHARGKTARGSIVAYYKGMPAQGNWMVYEGWGFERLRRSWQRAIESGIDGVEMLTCNDYVESTYFDSWRADDPVIFTHPVYKQVLLDHSGFRYFSKRYVQWFKTGVEPAITKDELYYAYRLHPRNAPSFFKLTDAEKAALQSWAPAGTDPNWVYRKESLPPSYASVGPNWSMASDWTRLSDGIHVAVRLTAPADVYINGVKVGDNLSAGEHLLVKPGAISESQGTFGYPIYTFGPSDFGKPTFEIRRNGQTIAAHTGELEITAYCAPGNWNIFARRAPDSAFVPIAPPKPTLSEPADGSSFSSGTSIAISATLADSTTPPLRVEFFDDENKIGEATNAPWAMTWTPAASGTHSITARAIGSNGLSETSSAVSVTIDAPAEGEPPPSPPASEPPDADPENPPALTGIFAAVDVGPPAIAGSSNYDSAADTYRVQAAGRDIWDGRDEFRFLHQPTSGDCEIVARVAALTFTDYWTKAGLMMRSSLDAESLHVSVFVAPGPRVAMQWRSDRAGTSRTTAEIAAAGLQWIKLARAGDLFSAFSSSDGVHWDLVGRVTVALPADVETGLAVTSHNVGLRATAEFTDVSIRDHVEALMPTIASPAAGSIIDTDAAVNVSASISGDVSTLARVTFLDGGISIGEATAAPYTISWKPANSGAHALSAQTTSSDGTVVTGPAVTITARASAPKPSIAAPAANAIFDIGEPIAVSASFSESTDRLARVSFFDGATTLGEQTAAPFAFTWTDAAVGTHLLIATAITDEGAATSSDSVAFTVRAPAPVPTISAPAADAVFDIGAVVDVVVSFTASTAQLARVSFFDGTTKIGESSAAPFAFSWTGAAPGVHAISATAITNDGASASSAPVAITLRAPDATPPAVPPPVEPPPIAPPPSPPDIEPPPVSEPPPVDVAPGVLLGVSTRGSVGTSDDVMIAGFVVGGDKPQRMLVRAIGPTLEAFDVPDPLSQVHLDLISGARTIAVADDWAAGSNAPQIAAAAESISSFPLAATSHDSAMLVTLEPGAYTAVISGRGGSTGVGLVEVFDAGSEADASNTIPAIRNISTRGRVGVGDTVLIAGLIIKGTTPARILIRAVGPSLARFGVAGQLDDPLLRLYKGSDVIASNDNWSADADAGAKLAAAFQSVHAFSLPDGSKDAALLLELPPGPYTAHVAGVGDTTGVALVEVYLLP